MLRFKVTDLNEKENEGGKTGEVQVTAYGEKPVLKEGEKSPYWGRANNSVIVFHANADYLKGIQVGTILTVEKE